MDDDAVAEADALSRLERQAAVLGLVVEEITDPKRVNRVQPVPARMPVRRMARVAWMIHHHDTQPFSVDLAGVIHPFGPLAPDIGLALAPLGVPQLAGFRG